MVGEILLILMAVLVICLTWVMVYDSTHFEQTCYVISDPKIRKRCKAAVIADLHNQKYGRDNELLLEAIRKEKPDVVLLAGDILTARAGAKLDTALRFLEELSKDYPIFYGEGNHEHRMRLYPKVYGDLARQYEDGLKGFGLEIMKNQKRILEETGICVTGAEIHQRFYKRFRHVPMEKEYLTELLGNPEKKYYQVLLAHNPDYFPEYASWGADLVLSGHVHGGVARIPVWNRGVLSPAMHFFPKYDGGLFREGNGAMILSRGLGSHTIPFRLFNPGELIFIEFISGAPEIKTLKRKANVIKYVRAF